jgi:hypothetical protein
MIPVLKVPPIPTWTCRDKAYSTEHARANLRLILLEAVAWASAHADPKDASHCLRSPRLAPHIFNDSRYNTVDDVVSARHRELQAEGRIARIGGRFDDLVEVATLGLADVVALVPEGRLLVRERDTTIDDGAGQAETRGYLDESDMPPWDTWVTYFEGSPNDRGLRNHAGCLVSWVPPIFLPAVDSAIRVNAYGALYWLHDCKLPFADVFRPESLFAEQ